MTLGLAASLVLLPAPADAAKKPRITAATMRDADGDLHADGVLVGWSTPIKHKADSDGSYPLAVAGYTIQSLPKIKGAREILVPLAELNKEDGDARPAVSYAKTASKPITSKKGKQAPKQTFPGTVAFGQPPAGPPAGAPPVEDPPTETPPVLDTTPPETTIDSGTAGLTAVNDQSFTFSSDDPTATFECRLDADAFAVCSSPKAFIDVADGSHTFTVHAVDPAGNVDATPAARAFTVDTQAPETTIDGGPSGLITDPTPTYSFSSADPTATFQCRVQPDPFGPCSGPGASHTPVAIGDENQRQFEVRATDAAGNADSSPASRTFSVDLDGDGFVAPQDCNGGDASVNPSATDLPDDATVDKDCDGVDGESDNAIFVATSGSNTAGCGTTPATPCSTIGNGLTRAGATGRRDVYVRQGTYNATVTLSSGKSLYGGYGAGFTTRTPGAASNGTTINGQQNVAVLGTTQTVAMIASAVSNTTVADLTIQSPNASGTESGNGKSSYGVVLSNSGTNLTFRGVSVSPGNGAAGTAGSNGTSPPLTAAATGDPGVDAEEVVSAFCDATTHGAGGDGATNPFASSGLAGGGRGGNGGERDTSCTVFLGVPTCVDCTASAGDTGGSAAVTFGIEGTGGGGGSGGSTCGTAADGRDGRVSHGSAGAGGSASGHLTNSFWYADSGTAGSLGLDGGGGGGGGGSGGCDIGSFDAYGAGGGGGGAGGAKAPTVGGAGGGGGGSFGFYLINSTATITQSSIARGVASQGAVGGGGAVGQLGGPGGPGGDAAPSGSAGGAGGDGGRGGSSGGGGGGAGGISFGIYRSSSSSSVTSTSVTQSGGGSAPTGGTGGTVTPGNSGSNGAAGLVGTSGVCSSASNC